MAKQAQKKDRKLLILTVLTILVLTYTAYIVADKSSDDYEKPRVYFIEEIQGKAEDIATIHIFNQGKKLTIRKRGGKWLIDKMYDYEVDESIINRLIVNVQELKVVEKKTSSPERFESLGLVESETEPFVSRIIMSNTTDDFVYADFIRGKQRPFGKLNSENAIYVKKTNENQAWLVKGNLEYNINIDTFLNKPDYKIAKDSVMKVTYTPKNGEEYEITRMMPTVDFDITRPSSKEPESKHQLNLMGEVLEERFVIIDVRPDTSDGYFDDFVQKVNFRTYDGIDLTLTVVENSGEGVWVKISSRAFKNALESQARRINSIAKGWVYRVSDETSMFILKKLSDIEKKSKEKGKK